MKVWKGEAWTSEALCPAKARQRAGFEETVGFCRKIRDGLGNGLKAYIVFDGQMQTDEDFDLHLHFDLPVGNRSLLVKNITKGDNPLLVIEKFQ